MNPEGLHVTSEVGRLRSVMVHRPGPELEHMVPETREDFLFDEILWLRGARAEHDIMTAILRLACGPSGVLYARDMLVEALREEAARTALIRDVCELETKLSGEDGALRSTLNALDPSELADVLIAGRMNGSLAALAGTSAGGNLFHPRPIPNLLFMRDPSPVAGDCAIVSSMTRAARRRESLLMSHILRRHPRFASEDGPPIWWDLFVSTGSDAADAHIEGGDVQILNQRALLIGCSERTNYNGVEAVSRALLAPNSQFETVYVVVMPPRRAWMHLDTVFTLISQEECVLFAPLFRGYGADGVRVLELTLVRDEVRVKEHSTFLPDLLHEREGLCASVIECGGEDRLTQEREQWTDGANLFALCPGVVMGYERNDATYEALSRVAYEVIAVDGYRDDPDGSSLCVNDRRVRTDGLGGIIELDGSRKLAIRISGGELSRGRGGVHCMTMPLARDDPH